MRCWPGPPESTPASLASHYAWWSTARILGLPYTRAMGGGLFEIRAKGQEGIGRAFFCTMTGRRIIILHGFIKKTDKTPKHELDIALQRMKEMKNG